MKKPLHTEEQIENMRQRLYQRDVAAEQVSRHQLTDEKVEVSQSWDVTRPERPHTTDLREGVDKTTAPAAPVDMEEPVLPKPRRRYRAFVLGMSFLIFIIVAGLSSLWVLLGGNQISNDNIQLTIDGQPLLGGGEVLPLEIAVTNLNSVAIESATLILKYPVGTRSVGDSPRNLFEERIAINDVYPGEVQNIPVKVAIFGEENDEKVIEATVEYRINGSNGMFYKDADPFTLRISSSPLVLRVDSVEKVASGQLVDVTLTAVSNASTPLENILVTAQYPNGFVYESADPAPIYGENVWRIDRLDSEEEFTIKLEGVVTGLTEETLLINFDAGPANPDNQYLVGANLAEVSTEFQIERPFIDVGVAINGRKDREVIIAEGYVSTVDVSIKNTLDETVYDLTVEVVPSGNALDQNSIESTLGFYDSNTGTVRWEVSNNDSFEEVLPGDTRQLHFTVAPGEQRSTASFDLRVNVYARRVAETSAQETLIGTSRAEAKYSSSVTLGSQVGRNVGRFGDSGPIPPTVGETTTYTVALVAEGGANDLANAIVKTSLPVYVNWLDQYDAPGIVTYNNVSKELQWNIGDIKAGERKELLFQVSIRPSISQVGQKPILINEQSIKANDRFTGALLQDSVRAVTTELSSEMGYQDDNGEVVQ
ncbi:MAG: hypothetical protein KC877_04140 [Candidatus Kaiserbacteria bacterium]|nr:hypothetical protein [Candidatus Kaiserbacteria bacterium]MCB9816375.1 hypothetical protein [Candidatus Nomurabacteria bacterium]